MDDPWGLQSGRPLQRSSISGQRFPAMLLLDQTLDTAAANLALDEAILIDPSADPVLRFWEPTEPLVVLGRSSRVEEEVDRAACHAEGVEIVRRASGGATIVTGPGCLMYSIVQATPSRVQGKSVESIHGFVLGTMVRALQRIDPTLCREGTSDLACNLDQDRSAPRKFSGNSLRLARGRMLYHGTLLYDFDLDRIPKLLRTPPRQPDYRQGRDHTQFVTNLQTQREVLVHALSSVWGARNQEIPNPDWYAVAERLVAERYGTSAWNFAR